MQTFRYSPQDEALIQVHTWGFNSDGYVRKTTATDDGERYLHRLLLNPGPGQEVDHIDGDPSNNTRSNLRLCTHQQNAAARSMPKRDLPRGVSFDKRTGKYTASIRYEGKLYWLGRHSTVESAQAARDKEAKSLFGEFAKTGRG